MHKLIPTKADRELNSASPNKAPNLEVDKMISLIEQNAYGDFKKGFVQENFDPHARIEYTFPDCHEEEIPNPNNVTPLMIASYLGHCEIVNILLENLSANESETRAKGVLKAKRGISALDDRGNTALHLASLNGHCEVIKSLLDAGIDIDFTNWKGKHALSMASRSGKLVAVNLLLDQSADADIGDWQQNLAIHEATWYGHLEIVKVLLRHRPGHLERENRDSHTPLLNAAQAGHSSIVKYLFTEDANREAIDDSGMTVLHYASWSNGGNVDIVRVLLESDKELLQITDNLGRTPVLSACFVGNQPIVDLLVKHGAQLGDVDYDKHQTALHLASSGGNLGIVQMLVNGREMSVHDKNDDLETPLHLACLSGHFHVAQFLIASEADSDAKDCRGHTALHNAISGSKDLGIVKLLVGSNEKLLDMADHDGRTPLLTACYAGNLPAFEFLRANGAGCNAVDTLYHNNALHQASWGGDLDIFKTLVELFLGQSQGTKDIHALNDEQKTPLHIACLRGNFSIVKYLIETADADPCAEDSQGNTALHNASSEGEGMLEIVKFILPSHGKLLEAPNNDGSTPLMLACQAGNSSVVKYFLEQGAKVDTNSHDSNENTEISNKDTALHVAVSGGHLVIARMLLKHNEKLLNAKSKDGTPLLLARPYWDFEIVCFLCDEYGDQLEINAKDSEEDTILHNACGRNVGRIIKWLLEQNAEVVQNRVGRNPLHMACYAGHVSSAKALLDHLARDRTGRPRVVEVITTEDTCGDTPLSDAVNQEHISLALELLRHDAYFPKSSPDPPSQEVYISGSEESKTVSKVLRNCLETTYGSTENDSGDASGANKQELSQKSEATLEFLKSACYWAISNGDLALVETCMARAKDTGTNFTLKEGAKTWEDVFDAGLSDSKKWVNKNTWKRFRESANLQPPENVGKILVHLAVENGILDVVTKALDWRKPDASSSLLDVLLQRIPDGKEKDVTLISLAASGGTARHYEVHRFLWDKIKEEAKKMELFSRKSRQPTDFSKDTRDVILGLAAQFGEEHTLRYFLQPISELDTETGNHDTLELAIRLQYPQVVYWLLSNGGYLDEKNIRKGLDILDSMKQSQQTKALASIRQILETPPDVTKHGRRSEDHMPPSLEIKDDEYQEFPEGTIVDFIISKEREHSISRLQRRSMNTILSTGGIRKIMKSGVKYNDLFSQDGGVKASKGVPGEPQTGEKMQRKKVRLVFYSSKCTF